MKRGPGRYRCELLWCCAHIFLMLPFFCSLQFGANEEEGSHEEIFDEIRRVFMECWEESGQC